MSKKILLLLFLAQVLQNVNGQDITRSNIIANDANSTTPHYCNVLDNKIICTAFNRYDGTSEYSLVVLDTLFQVEKYINLNEIDPGIVSGQSSIIKTSDGGFLLRKPSISDSIAFNLIKFDNLFSVQWFKQIKDIHIDYFRPHLFEIENIYFHFSYFHEYSTSIKGLFVHKLDLDGNVLDAFKLTNFSGNVNLDDVKFINNKWYIGYKEDNGNGFVNTISELRVYDKDFTLEKFYVGDVWVHEINVDENGNVFYLSNYEYEPFVDPIPSHQVRKLDSELNYVWNKEYLNPPFNFPNVGQPSFLYNIAKYMYPDPRGGYYVVGHGVGYPEDFGITDFSDHIIMAGMTMFNIDKDGNMRWSYGDTISYLQPLASGQLSSGSLVTVGQGKQWNGQNYSSVITLIKSDRDACEEPGCREAPNSVNEHIKNDINYVYPNPAESKIYLSQEISEEAIVISIYNIQGKELKRYTEPKSEYDISYLAEGIYTYTLTLKDGSKRSGKWIKI